MEGIQAGLNQEPSTVAPWRELLHDLEHHLPTRVGDRWRVEWAVHGWARRCLGSAAIRVGNSEGLIGPAPARWRVLLHAEDGDLGGCALAILDGRAASTTENVVASLLIAPGVCVDEDDPTHATAIVSVIGEGTSLNHPPPPSTPSLTVEFVERPSTATMAQVLLGKRPTVTGPLDKLPAPLRLASARALAEAGGALLTRRQRFAAARDARIARKVV
ncbi:MAG: hypothetical protein KC431_20095 [Myxococcales bacterium]|nr:hypothetical protein [Myxococcales bacterium]MCA9699837.1 hypothetical protein [Myxococcales bacterium]